MDFELESENIKSLLLYLSNNTVVVDLLILYFCLDSNISYLLSERKVNVFSKSKKQTYLVFINSFFSKE